MTEIYNKLNQDVIAGFREKKGKAIVSLSSPIDATIPVAAVIDLYIKHNGIKKIYVVLDNYDTRVKLIDQLKYLKVDVTSNKDGLRILTQSYVNTKFLVQNDLVITIGIQDDLHLIKSVTDKTNHYLHVFTKQPDNDKMAYYYKEFNKISVAVDIDSLSKSTIYCPVEEIQVSVNIDSMDEDKYREYDKYIKDTMSIFNDTAVLSKCVSGDPRNNMSAAEFRYNLAIHNNWSEELDTTQEFNRAIDEIYNPNALLDRAKTFASIVVARRNMCTDNKSKLDFVLDIIRDNKDKKILIVSKRGEFASLVTSTLNENGYNCLDCHDNIEKAIAVDKYGNQILVKSGVNKGKPKVIAAKAQSTNNINRFNNGDVNILSIKGSTDSDIAIDVDIIIFTSTFCPPIFEFKSKFKNIRLLGLTPIYYTLYSANSIEVSKLTKDGENQLISITQYSNSQTEVYVDY